MISLEILNQRLHNQHIAGTPVETPEAVVRWLGAAQSQDYAGAKWSVGQRTKGATSISIDQAFASGKILRTHVLRPTWHFVTPADSRWMVELTAPRIHALNAYYYRKFELDDALFARSHALFTQALEGGNHLTRPELAAILEQAGIVADKLRLSYIMMQAELEGLLCSGTLKGKQQTYALLEERAPDAKHLPREEALAELTRRFFVGHGPATIKDFVWWSGLAVADAKAGLESVKQELEHDTREGYTFWFSPAMEPAPPLSDAAYLIPEYDESLLAYKDFGMEDLPSNKREEEWHDVWYRPIVIAGKRAGTWRRTVTNQTLLIEANLFTSLDAAQLHAVEAAVQRYGAFMEMPAQLVILG